MKENKRLLTLFGTYSAILLLAAIIGVIVLSAKGTDTPPETQTVLETEIVYVWAEPPFSSTIGTSEAEQWWTVREYEDIIGVFDSDGRLVYTLDVYVKTLPETDRKLLREGIHVSGERELRNLIEDYTD